MATKKADFYVMVNRHQTITYLSAEDMWKYLNPPLNAHGQVTKRNLLKEFPKPSNGGCPFSAYKNAKGDPVWPYDAVFVLKNGKEVFCPEPSKVKVTAEVESYEVEGYKPPKKAPAKK